MRTTDDKNQYTDDGLDGFLAFGFRPGSDVKQPYRLCLPEKLPAEFTIVATLKPMSLRTSYLFAVLNPFDTIVQLGLRISVSTNSFPSPQCMYISSNLSYHQSLLNLYGTCASITLHLIAYYFTRVYCN